MKGSLDSLIIPGGAQRSTDDKLNKFVHNEDAQTPYGSLPSSADHFDHHYSDNNNSYNNNHRKSPVGSALRSLFGLQSSSSRNSIHVVNNSGLVRNNSCNNGNNKEKKVATIVRHGSLKSDSRLYIQDVHERPIERKISLQDRSTSSNDYSTPVSTSKHHLGSDLFQRASKKLSASSSSLTSKFKFISSASQISTSNQCSTNNNTTTTTIAPTKNKESNFNNHLNFVPPDGGKGEGYYGKHYDSRCGQQAPNSQISSQVSPATYIQL